jgi:uncharacterized DUF497 family protein
LTKSVQSESGTRDVSFDWDDENISHLARHGIKPSEVEELIRNDAAIRGHEVVEGEDRWTSVGATGSLRVLVVVFTVRGEKIRPITGWDADRRTKKMYFSERGTT